MLKKIAELGPGVELATQADIGYFAQQFEQLDERASILSFIIEQSSYEEAFIRSALAQLDLKHGDVHKQIGVLSGGERGKVALASLLLGKKNILLLDEPTNFLDLPAKEALEELMKSYPGTILFTSHDRRFVESVATGLFVFTGQIIEHYPDTLANYQARSKEVPSSKEEERLRLENRLQEVIGKLSLMPTEQLEQEYEITLKQLKELRSK